MLPSDTFCFAFMVPVAATCGRTVLMCFFALRDVIAHIVAVAFECVCVCVVWGPGGG